MISEVQHFAEAAVPLEAGVNGVVHFSANVVFKILVVVWRSH